MASAAHALDLLAKSRSEYTALSQGMTFRCTIWTSLGQEKNQGKNVHYYQCMQCDAKWYSKLRLTIYENIVQF